MHTAYNMFEDYDGIYNYCPSPVKVDEDTIYVFYCANTIAGIVIDDIYMRKGKLINGKWKFGEQQCVLRPSQLGWDSIHVCDPDVIQGEFHYNGEQYGWMMVFLGCDIHYSYHNQIGIAFAKSIEGPYVKYEYNPIVPYSELYHWGAGQPCVISLDQKGKFRMLYSQTIHEYERRYMQTKTFWCDFDFFNANEPTIGEPVLMNEQGIFNKGDIDSSEVSVFNPSMMWDQRSDYYYLTREGTPFDREHTPGFISSYTQIFRISREQFELNRGGWEVIYDIDEEDTEFSRNHNAGIIKGTYGYSTTSQVEVAVTVSEVKDEGFLWTYRIYHINTGIALI